MKEKFLAVKIIFVFIILSISIYSIFDHSAWNAFAAIDNNMVSALAFQITSTPTSEPAGDDSINIAVWGDRTVVVSSSTYVTLRVGWGADSIVLVQSFFDVAQYTTYLNGVALPNSGATFSEINGVDDFDGDGDQDFVGYYYYDLGYLYPGTYLVRIYAPEHEPVFDNIDPDGCGEEGCIGPHDVSITLVVEGPEETITPIPTKTLTPTITPTPTHTNTPTPTQMSSIIDKETPTPTAVVDQMDYERGSLIPPLIFKEEYFNEEFREAGPLVPEFTTNIPSPLDISLEPEVIGTNIFLAAILMIPLAYSNELLSRMLEESEKKHLESRKAPRKFKLLGSWLEKTIAVSAKGRIVFKDKLRILILIIVYGLMFSLLDSSWEPFSKEGVLLFLSMAAIFGLVGMVDDFIQWRMIKKWKLPIKLKFKPVNLLVAAVSIVVSRFLFLMPGLMFGVPELLKTTEKGVPQEKQSRLLKTSMLTFTVIGLTAWILTIFTRIILQTSVAGPGMSFEIVGGIEAILLIIFAVVIENYFIHMLGLPGSFGRMLKKSNSKLWFVLLIATAFIFIHTLINPQGDLMTAIQKGNVIVFVGVVCIFVVGVLSTYAFLWFRKNGRNEM